MKKNLPEMVSAIPRTIGLARCRIWLPAILVALLLTAKLATAQSLQSYSSKVLTGTKQPVASAKVQNLKTGLIVLSGIDGAFTIQAASGDSLKITAPGYNINYVVAGAPALPDITLSIDETAIQLGPTLPVQRIYTTVTPSLNLASNAAVYNAEIIKYPVTSFRNALTGRLAGLYTLQSAGLPGSDGASFSLRGQTPVIVVDGVVANLTQFDLEEIESVTVLKDALGTAMLGTRGSGGAVVVTTRKGRADKQVVSFTAQTANQKSLGFPQTVGALDYATLYNEALKNDGQAPLYSDADLQGYRDQTNPIKYPNINWRDLVTNNGSAFRRYTLSATGGNKFARYFVALEHMNQDGIFKTVDSNTYNTNNNFKGYVIRSNVDVSITPQLTGGIYLLGRILNGNEPGATTGTILSNLLNTPANAYAPINPNGSFGGTQQFQNNVLAQVIGSGYRQNYKRDMLVNMYLKKTFDGITPGLWMQLKAAYYATLSENITRNKSFAIYQPNTAVTPVTYTQFGTNGTQANGNSIDYQGRTDYEELSIGYDRVFQKKHGVNILFLVNRDNSVGGSDLPYTIMGGSGRLSYNYKGKYVVEAAFGANGSNRYPVNGATKVGFFPSFGLGWNLEKEGFMSHVNFLSRLKLFGSYGKTGWDNPGYFTYIQRFFDAATTYFGTGASGNTSISEQVLANPNITWEKADKLNIGIDGAILKNRLGFSIEYFKNKFYDLLMQRGRNSTLLGNTYPDENIGQNQYTGWEGQLTYQETIRDFSFYLSANISSLNSKVLYVDEVFRQYDWMKRTGARVGQNFGYIAEGLFQTQAEINSSATTEGYTPQPGDIKYKDLNGDGIINQFDVSKIGNTKPVISYGLSLGASFKGFDISALIQGVQNRDIYYFGANYWPFQSGGFGQAYTSNLGRWTPATASTATFPRLNIGTNTNNQAFSSYWIRSGNYFRLKNMEIGYSLPASLIKRIGLQTFRVFANGYNLLTSASNSLDGRDPEVYNGAYPVQRLINFGVNIKF
ncbi:MAG: SusC/RagA family TonB-linked outer membrane protein [Bacteroidota bacterium]